MTEPYASIIIPSHDRAATLGASLRSALNQTVPNIEVIVVGDGCTAEVRDVARSFAADDARVRFLDLPKAPFHGAASRNRAVHEARSERIFYADDDDLLLPHHVETLGAGLDDADVVDTPPVSVQEDGAVSLGLHDSSDPAQRALLVEHDFKSIFDTHLAHRRSTYLRGESAWMSVRDRRVVLHMLQSFASDRRVVWRTLHRVTALSFHGACRVGMPAPDRAAELESWESRIGSETFERQTRDAASYVYHASRLFHTLSRLDRLEDADPVTTLLGRFAMSQAHAGAAPHISPEQAAAVMAIRKVVTGTKPDPGPAGLALDGLLDARLGPVFPTAGTVSYFRKVFERQEIRQLLDQCRARPAVTLAHFHLNAGAGPEAEARLRAIETECAAAPAWSRFFMAQSVIKALMNMGDLSGAWKWSEAIRADAPLSHYAVGFWELRAKLAHHHGQATQAAEAERMATMLADSDV